jgi:hypothetical protein
MDHAIFFVPGPPVCAAISPPYGATAEGRPPRFARAAPPVGGGPGPGTRGGTDVLCVPWVGAECVRPSTYSPIGSRTICSGRLSDFHGDGRATYP